MFVEIVRQKWPALSGLLLLVTINGLLICMMEYGQRPTVAALQIKWSSLRQQAAQAGVRDAAAQYKKSTTDLAELMKRIPEKREFARVLGELLDTASSNGVESGTISYKPVSIKEESLLSYQLSYSVTGSYAAIKSYLADLQRVPELIVIDSVTFANGDQFTENVTMNIHVTVYLRGGA